MKIQVPIDYKEVQITKSDHFIAKNSNKEFFMLELPKPIHKWWIDGYYTDEKFTEITLVDSIS